MTFRTVCITQIYNEIDTGNLKRFFKYAKPLFDKIIVYDDFSTDGSYEYSLENADFVIRGKFNNFDDEVRHKQILLEKALEFLPDFIVSLDADEILTDNAATELPKIFQKCIDNDADGIKLKEINLWRSYHWFRTDSLFNDGEFVKIWRVKPGIKFEKIEKGLHQILYPSTIKNILRTKSIAILHFGFADELNLSNKYLRYKKIGQRGYVDLDRIIKEDLLVTKKVKINLIPSEFKSQKKEKPIIKPFSESLKFVEDNSYNFNRPKYSIACLIYKSTKWLDFVYEQTLKYTNMEDTEFFFIANDASEYVIDHLKRNFIPYYEFNNTEKQKKEWYINNIYRAYNFAAKMARGDYLIFINSDMCFSPGWLDALKASYDGSNLIASRLVESGKLRTGKYGIEKNFGKDIDSYKENDFLNFANSIKSNGNKNGGLYMPLFVRKKHFIEIGGYPEGNLKYSSNIFSNDIARKNQKNIPGDEILMRRLKSKGITHQTAMNSIVYHFQCGEIDDNSKLQNTNHIELAICNDICDGFMGEKVLWNHLLDNISGAYRVDSTIVGEYSFEAKAREYITSNHKNTKVIIQNASFIKRIDPDKFTIVFLQDDFRSMKKPSQTQELNLKFADIIVTNSIQTSISYPEYDCKIIPIGIDSKIFKPLNKNMLRKKYGYSIKDKVGIFVGNFSEVKGWSKVLKSIKHFKDIKWILVTKYDDDQCNEDNVQVYKRVKQEILAELLNCSDFFIIGSPVETQCLAALEANFCNIPVVMPLVGIYKDFSQHERKSLGEFTDNFITGINKIFKQNYNPRSLLLKKGMNIEKTIENWNSLIKIACQESLIYELNKQKKYHIDNSLFTLLSKLRIKFRTFLIRYFFGDFYWKLVNFFTIRSIKFFLRNLLIKLNLLNFVKKILGRL